MVLVPSGAFQMGSNSGPLDERPAHRLDLDAFWIDRTPITNQQFAAFLNAVGTRTSDGRRIFDATDPDARIHRHNELWTASLGFEKHPVVEVSWRGAVAYCRWQGKRLPTEAEWEKAARGPDGRAFPWGDEAPTQHHAQFNAGWNQTAAVGHFAAGSSPYGVADMAGNVWEWVSTAYRPYPYQSFDGREDVTAEAVRSTRGGGHDSPAEEITATQRGRNLSRNPNAGHHNIGFRCAR